EEEKGLRERVLFADRPKRTVPPAAGGGLQERKADDEPGDRPGDLAGGEDEVDAAGRDGAARHAVVPGAAWLLRKADAAGRLDVSEPLGPVGSRPGQYHPDGFRALNGSQGTEKAVDGHVMSAPRPRARQKPEKAPLDLQVHGGRNDVDVVRLNGSTIASLIDRHRCDGREERGEDALVRRIEVLHEHERRAGVRRQALQQLFEGIDAAGGGADADHEEGALRDGFGLCPYALGNRFLSAFRRNRHRRAALFSGPSRGVSPTNRPGAMCQGGTPRAIIHPRLKQKPAPSRPAPPNDGPGSASSPPSGTPSGSRPGRRPADLSRPGASESEPCPAAQAARSSLHTGGRICRKQIA